MSLKRIKKFPIEDINATLIVKSQYYKMSLYLEKCMALLHQMINEIVYLVCSRILYPFSSAIYETL